MPSHKTPELLVARNFIKEIESLFVELVDEFEVIEGFDLAHWQVLMGLWDVGGKATQTETKRYINVQGYNSDLKRRNVIKTLVRGDMLEKSIDKKDERKILVSLKSQASVKVERYLMSVAEKINEFNENL